MQLLDAGKALSREKRTGIVSHYHGTLASLLEESEKFLSKNPAEDRGEGIPQRVRTFSQSTPGEIIYALRAVRGIRNSAVVIYGAPGCSAAGLWFNSDGGNPWYSANLNESDTILGGEKKLRTAIRRAYNGNHPEIIFVIGTPINGINNDDVDSVLLEMEEEIPCKMLYLEVNGFRTKNALSGYDVVFHSLLKHLVEPAENPGSPFVNLLSVSGSPGNVLAAAELLKQLEIPCNILPQFSSLRGIRAASRARYSVSLNDGENDYFLTGLEERFGVPQIRTHPPIGTAGTSAFIRKIAGLFDRGGEAEALIKSEKQLSDGLIARKPLAGSRVFLNVDLNEAAGFSSLAGELGGEISGMAIPCLDSQNAGALKELDSLPGTIPLIIAQGQQFEIANVLTKNPVDYFAGSSACAAAAAVSGAKPIVLDGLAYYGYAGIREL
ncbi:MAG: nitrogenase component 1, partial [Spirochaetaceae bacterium]|nr:nitrogenase component 1 [Spirochaetaceae bacterium]